MHQRHYLQVEPDKKKTCTPASELISGIRLSSSDLDQDARPLKTTSICSSLYSLNSGNLMQQKKYRMQINQLSGHSCPPQQEV